MSEVIVRNMNEGRENGPHYEGDFGVANDGRVAVYSHGKWIVRHVDEAAALRATVARLTKALEDTRDLLHGEFYAEALGEIDDALAVEDK